MDEFLLVNFAPCFSYLIGTSSQDETMHSGADVEAFTAELNRDIEGSASTSQQQHSDSDAGNISIDLTKFESV